jgi:uncharacterized protein
MQYGNRMKFNLEQPAAAHLVRAYGPGLLRIGERSFGASVIVTATTVIEHWRPRRMEDLEPADLEPLIALRPEVLLLGSGQRQSFPERRVLARLYDSRIGFEVMDTGAACRTYNVLVGEGRNVAAALIVEGAPG